MKTLEKIVLHGPELSKRTRWMRWEGFTMLHFTDGTTRYLTECGTDSALAQAKALGVDTTAYEEREAKAAKAHGYPPLPEAELYQHLYGYQKPVELGGWQWSSTFGRWGRLVTFADGWHGFTWPKTF